MSLPYYLDLTSRPWEAYRDARWPVVTLDFETTNKEKGDAREPDNRVVLQCAQVGDGPPQTGEKCSTILWDLSGKPCVLVAHNAKFELMWLNRIGIDTTHWLVWDTMIAEFVLAGNRRWDLDLDSVAQRYGLGAKGRLVDRLMKGGVCPSEIPAHLLMERVLWDVDRTYKLFVRQVQILGDAGLIPCMFTRCIFTPVLAAIEPEGMTLDRERVIIEYERCLQRRAELLVELGTMANGKRLKGPQLAELVYDDLGFAELTRYGRTGKEPIRTVTGRRKTDAATLGALKATTPEQKRFVALRKEYGKVDAALTKSLEFFYWVCEERGGNFVANFNQTRVATHRLSSSGKPLTFKNGKRRSVQFQNLPREYKRLFVAPDGHMYAEADGAQLEWRIGGSLGRDEQVLSDVLSGHDVHRFTASVLERVPMDDVTKEQRQRAKGNTFKPMYGGRRGTKREVEYYQAFRERYAGMSAEQERWGHEVLATGKLQTAVGLIFYWPDTRMKNDGYITNTPAIYDYPVQSLATAEIVPVSTLYLYWRCKSEGLGARLVNTVHDSVVALVPESEIDQYWKLVVECFLDRTYEYMAKVYGIDLYIPLGVTYKSGKHWGEGNERTVSYAV